jgi:WD40 repeat protein
VINKAHNGWIFSLHFYSDSQLLASGSSDTTVKIWNTLTWEVQWTLSCGGNVRCIRYMPWASNKCLAVATDDNIQIYECHYDSYYRCYNSLRLTRTIGGGFNYTLAWTPDGKRLFSGGNGVDPTIREWENSYYWTQISDPWKGHFKNIHAISLNPSGTLLASASDDNRVRLWRVSDRRTIAIFAHSGEVNCVTFSANGKHILSGGVDRKISEWPISEDALPEGPNDGLMKERATHQVSLFSFSCPFNVQPSFYAKAQAYSDFRAGSRLLLS